MNKLAALVPLLALGIPAGASTVYGTLNNFDTVNDTGQPCHGFEIELDDLHSTDITYTYDYNHYGKPSIREDNSDPAHPKVFIRYASAKDVNGNFLAFTAVPSAPISPTNGHQCTNPAVNLGCEHFGVGYRTPPSLARYNWLVDDGQGNLVLGPPVNLSTPTWTYVPPAPNQPAVVEARVVAPPAPEVHPKEFGEATWVKAIKTTTHNNREVELRDLVSDDPDRDDDRNWRNGEPAEVETEWYLLQQEFAKPGEGRDELGGAPEELEGGDEVVTRRYEFYQYAGPYDPESNEALCDEYPQQDPVKPECDTELLGDYIGAQMGGFDAEAALGLIDNIQDGTVGESFVDRTVAVGGNTPYLTTVTLGALPPGLALDTETAVLSGEPTLAGLYGFTVHVLDADGSDVARAYEVRIAPAAVVVVPGDADADGDVDLDDLGLMRVRFGQPAVGADDPYDLNGDGVVNVLDYRSAINLCTRPRCALN